MAFGFDVWALFLSETRPLMTAIMEAPYPQDYQSNAITVFLVARSVGAALGTAYLIQAIAAVAAMAAVVWLWLPSTAIDDRRRAVITATLAIVATPYGYTYDTIPMCVAIAYMFAVVAKPPMALLAIAWLYPLFAHRLNYEGLSVGAIVPHFGLGVDGGLGTRPPARGDEWCREPSASASPHLCRGCEGVVSSPVARQLAALSSSVST